MQSILPPDIINFVFNPMRAHSPIRIYLRWWNIGFILSQIFHFWRGIRNHKHYMHYIQFNFLKETYRIFASLSIWTHYLYKKNIRHFSHLGILSFFQCSSDFFSTYLGHFKINLKEWVVILPGTMSLHHTHVNHPQKEIWCLQFSNKPKMIKNH